MKRLFTLCMPLCMVACNSSTDSGNAATSKDTTMSSQQSAPVTYAYPIGYSADFEQGNSQYAQTVLKLWKDYNNNSLDNDQSYFADTVMMEFANGSGFKGNPDSVVAAVKKARGAYASAVSTVDVVTTLKPKGKDEQWVCVWGKEVDEQNGKRDSVYLNENWRFNKDGKIDFMTQYMQKTIAPK